MNHTLIRAVANSDEAAFVEAARRSRKIHSPWVTAPITPEQFSTYLLRFSPPSNYGFIVTLRGNGQLVGAINITNVVLGVFRSGYLGFYAFAGFEKRGLMKQGLRQVCRHAFSHLHLHRVEANIQPTNLASIALVKSCGFALEGYSPRYLKIGGRWRDHERWTLLAS